MRIVKYLSYAILASLLVAAAGGAVLWQQGYRAFAMRTGSMVPTYDPGSLVVVAPERRTPAVGDVITFRTGSGLVTHRVHGVTTGGVTTKGDANDSADAWTIAPAQVVGRVALGVQRAGYLVVFLQQPTGAPALALIAVSTVLAWSLFFPATSTSPTARGDRRRHRGTGAAIAGWLVLAAATSSVGLAAGSAPPTGAYFTDSRAASLSFSVGCEDSHDHGNGPDNGAGHDKCHGNGHTKDRSDANK